MRVHIARYTHSIPNSKHWFTTSFLPLEEGAGKRCSESHTHTHTHGHTYHLRTSQSYHSCFFDARSRLKYSHSYASPVARTSTLFSKLCRCGGHHFYPIFPRAKSAPSLINLNLLIHSYPSNFTAERSLNTISQSVTGHFVLDDRHDADLQVHVKQEAAGQLFPAGCGVEVSHEPHGDDILCYHQECPNPCGQKI